MAMNQHNEPDSVARFLRENRREVADNGFTEKVMERLPRRYEQLATLIRWIGGVAAVILFIILGGMEWLVASGEPVYMAARVTEGEGDLTAFWRTLEASIPADGAARLLVREDGRPRLNEGGGLATVSEAQPLDAFTPLAVAELRLREDPTLSEADRNRYLDLLRQAIGGME